MQESTYLFYNNLNLGFNETNTKEVRAYFFMLLFLMISTFKCKMSQIKKIELHEWARFIINSLEKKTELTTMKMINVIFRKQEIFEIIKVQ